MMQISKPLYIYLQRPDTAQWVTIGRYLLDDHSGVIPFPSHGVPNEIDSADASP
jgi:serine/threonine-protein kinase HipA